MNKPTKNSIDRSAAKTRLWKERRDPAIHRHLQLRMLEGEILIPPRAGRLGSDISPNKDYEDFNLNYRLVTSIGHILVTKKKDKNATTSPHKTSTMDPLIKISPSTASTP